MELRHLRYFVAVAEELHFSRAAERLNIAPPTLSHQIRALEAMLRAQLFTRRTKSAVSLTYTGKRFLEEARATIRQAEKAELVGRRAARSDTGIVSIGFVASATYIGLLSDAMRRFRETEPKVVFDLRRMEAFPQMQALVNGEIDLGLTRTPLHYAPELTGFVVDRRPFCVALPEDHPLAAVRQLTPKALASEAFVASSLEMEVDFRGNISAVLPPGASPAIAAKVSDTISLLTQVAAGIGIGVVADSLQHVSVPGVVYRRVTGASRLAEISAVYRKNEDAPVVRSFVSELRAAYGQGEHVSVPAAAMPPPEVIVPSRLRPR